MVEGASAFHGAHCMAPINLVYGVTRIEGSTNGERRLRNVAKLRWGEAPRR